MEDSIAETIRANVGKKIDSFVEGDLEHAAELISALWEIADKEGDIKPASNPELAVSFSLFCLAQESLILHIRRPRRQRILRAGNL